MRTPIASAAHPMFVPRRNFLVLIPLALIASLPLAAQPSALADAFARLDKTAPQFRALTADMQRDVYTAVIKDHEKDMGAIKVKREKSHEPRMLIDFTGGDAKTVSVDDAHVSVYLPKSQLVQIYDFGSKRSLLDQFLLLGFGASSAEIKQDYDVSFIGEEKIGADSTWHLQLIPKSADVLHNLKKAELWIAEGSGLPVQQRFVTSSTGDFTLVTYSNVKFNPSLSDGDLKLKYPKGVKVEHPQL